MTQSEEKHLLKAQRQGGLGTYLRALAIVHRAGSRRTQREVEEWIADADCADEFIVVNGALLHRSETA